MCVHMYVCACVLLSSLYCCCIVDYIYIIYGGVARVYGMCIVALSVKGFFCNEIILSQGSEHPHYVNDYTAKCIYHNCLY